MNTAWLPALGLVLVLVLVVGVWLLRRGRRVASPPAVAAPPAAPPVAPLSAARSAPLGGDAAGSQAAELDARRQATADALRLARQRKAEEAARLEAGQAAQARAEAAARAAPRSPAPPRPTMPGAQLGWSSRPMDLGPAESPVVRPLPARSPRPAAAAPAAAQPVQPPAPPVAAVPGARLASTTSPAVPPAAPAPPFAAASTAAPAPFLPQAVPVPSSLPPPRPAAAASPASAGRVPVVLVADDSKVVRVKTGRLLQKQGWQVLLADDGAAALKLLDSHTPDLLITDVEMPGVDGFTLTRAVRGHARCARLPVIMITSSDERHRAEAQAAGVDLLLGKPYEEDALLAQARRLLGVAAAALH